METGTGKTYVYLRTIYELAERYGWLKFIIVVPSVAIREGVKENLRITAEHFRSLYHQTARVQVYEGKRVQELRSSRSRTRCKSSSSTSTHSTRTSARMPTQKQRHLQGAGRLRELHSN